MARRGGPLHRRAGRASARVSRRRILSKSHAVRRLLSARAGGRVRAPLEFHLDRRADQRVERRCVHRVAVTPQHDRRPRSAVVLQHDAVCRRHHVSRPARGLCNVVCPDRGPRALRDERRILFDLQCAIGVIGVVHHAKLPVRALPRPRDVAGTWQGSYWQLGMVYYADDADCTLQIKEDSTFIAKCTRSAVGTNNIAKSSSWSGHVVTTANGIVLKNNGGPWPSIVLRRHGDTMYATTLDPLVGATIEMEFERSPHTTAGTGG